jgi:hypothetical protein
MEKNLTARDFGLRPLTWKNDVPFSSGRPIFSLRENGMTGIMAVPTISS